MTTNIDVEVAPPPQSSDFRGGGGGYGARVISKDSTVDEGGTPSSDDDKKSRNKAGGAPTPPPQSTKNGATTTATAMSTTKTTTPPPSHDEGGSTGIAATPEAASSQLPSMRPRHRISDDDDDDDDIVASLAEGLGGVSISSSAAAAPPPSLPHPGGGRRGTAVWKTAPEAIKNIAALLSSDKYTNIVVLTGAGVSCNAGIPDFRSPGTGLYDNLQKYNLPFPEAVFDLGFYGRNPDPFVHLASELWPGLRHSPTITHSFIALLERKGLLLRNYTQNIDMLDVLAGVSEDRMIECHGHFRTASCTRCKRPYNGVDCKRVFVEEKRAPTCNHCRGYVKPDIVFFGESLPPRYHRLVRQDTKKADLLLVMGTSLMVSPVNMIPDMVTKSCRRVLLNRELVGTFTRSNGPRTRSKQHDTSAQRDIFHGGDCDESVRTLCAILGWENELDELNSSTRLGG